MVNSINHVNRFIVETEENPLNERQLDNFKESLIRLHYSESEIAQWIIGFNNAIFRASFLGKEFPIQAVLDSLENLLRTTEDKYLRYEGAKAFLAENKIEMEWLPLHTW